MVLSICTVAGCDESLPPRLQDPNAISVSVIIAGGTISVTDDVVGGNGGLIEASVGNIYTEVLQDTAAINIRCRIWLANFPDSVGIATIDASSLTTPHLISNEMITILPHTVANFEKHWDYRTRGGTPFWSLIPLKQMTDSQGPYRISDPVEVRMSDTVRIFKSLPDYTTGPSSFSVQFEIR
jgi:hypothetical protein